MLAPRWLQIVVCIAVFNAVLVAASLVHRHLWAVEPPAIEQASELRSATTPVEITSTTPESVAELTPQEKLQQLAPPVLHSNPRPVADDDPLMAEIRKQAAGQFPDLNIFSTQTSDAKMAAGKPTETSELQSRLEAVGHLSTAAQCLLQRSSELRASGKGAEADKIDLQAQQLQATIREMLQ